MNSATLGSGCFWCVEAIYKELKGIISVEPGYMGGMIDHPSYEQVCTGMTGHAEVVHLSYDEDEISFEEILEVFWKIHDPTTLNRQGNDIGTQYRSAIFYHNNQQKEIAEKIKAELSSSGAFSKKIVTEITPASTFYVAENYHHDYLKNNPGNSYCQLVVQPKVEKFRKAFAPKLKP